MSEKLTDEEMSRRKPVWVALSDLFLDTDVSLFDEHLLRTLDQSEYTASQAERILRDEVGPVFFSNLLAVAGEWAGWPDEWVVSEVTKYLSKPAALRAVQRLASKPVVDKVVETDWLRVKAEAWGDE